MSDNYALFAYVSSLWSLWMSNFRNDVSASCKRSLSKLKVIRNYFRYTMGQARLSDLTILSIEIEGNKSADFDGVINDFAVLKARKGDL